jgi:hypothetical protein
MGASPRPASTDDLLSRIRDDVRQLLGPVATGIERTVVTGALDGTGPHIARLDVDLTGVAIDKVDERSAGQTETSDVQWTYEDAVIRSLRLTAKPMHVFGAPVDFALDAADLPVRWATANTGALVLADSDDTSKVRGTLRVSVPQADLVRELRRGLALALGEGGMHLRSFDLQTESADPYSVVLRAAGKVRRRLLVIRTRIALDAQWADPRSITAHARATVGWGLLSVTVRATLDAEVDKKMVARIRALRLTSANPIAAVFLRSARREIREVIGRKVDLREALTGGMWVNDIQIQADDTLAVTIEAGPRHWQW